MLDISIRMTVIENEATGELYFDFFIYDASIISPGYTGVSFGPLTEQDLRSKLKKENISDTKIDSLIAAALQKSKS